MADDPPTLRTPKSDDTSIPQSTENPSLAGAVPISITASSTPLPPLQIPQPLPPSVGAPPQFVPAQSHPGYQNPNLQPPGMSGRFPPPPGQMIHQPYQQQIPQPGVRPFAPMPNGYAPQQPPHQGTVPIPVS